MKRSEKEQNVTAWSEKLKVAKAVILAEYRGLKVSELTELRREVKKHEGDIRVVKNRLAKRALQGGEMVVLQEHLQGPIALAFTTGDSVGLAKILTKFATAFEPFRLKAGFFAGKLITNREIDLLAKLPSREELYAKILGTMVAPATNVVRAMKAVPEKLVRTLKAIEGTKGG